MHRLISYQTVVAALLFLLGAPTLWGQAFPSRPLRLVVAFAPGGPVDITARMMAPRLGGVLGQNVIVDNRAGANGIIGAEYVAKSAPDGYTMLLASPGSVVVSPAFYAKMPFDTVRDLAPVSQVSTTGEVFVVHASVPAKSVQELVAVARTGKSALNFATGGTGSVAHLAIVLLNVAAKIDIVHIPFTGMAPATASLIGGQVQGAVGDLPVLLPFIQSGKMRALAVASSKRAALLPNLPTMTEEGFPSVEAINWYALFVPAKTPREIISRLYDGVVKTLADREVHEQMAGSGTEPVGGTPDQLAELVQVDLARWSTLAKSTNLKLE